MNISPFLLAILPALGILAWLGIIYRLWLSRPWKFRFRLEESEKREEEPQVSVVIPARNEEDNIRGCLEDLLEQTYDNFEIIVVDDRSTDHTLERAREMSSGQDTVQVVEGAARPDNSWTGKSWAAWQGYRKAEGQYLLFVDADMGFDRRLLEGVVARQAGEENILFSLLPEQRLNGIFNKLLLPLHGLAILTVFPLSLVNDPRSSRAIAVGGFMFFPRKLYELIGGHRVVRSRLAEDLALSTRVKEEGGGVDLKISGLLNTKPYSGGKETFLGLTKHLLAAPFNPPLTIFVSQLCFILTHLVPLFLFLAGFNSLPLATMVGGLYFLIHLLMFVVYFQLPDSTALFLLTFPALLLYSAVNWLALYQSLVHGGPTWKGRRY